LTDADWDPLSALATLVRHRVRFVVIGGFAANILGSPMLTQDTDICYSRDPENLERLALALLELRARLRGPGVPEDLPFKLDATTLANGDHFTFMTSAGPLDILGTLAGVSGFDELDRAADDVEIAVGLVVRVPALDDLIRMKRAAGRPKDRLAVEELGALRDVRAQRAEEERQRRRAQGRGPESDAAGGSSGGPSAG